MAHTWLSLFAIRAEYLKSCIAAQHVPPVALPHLDLYMSTIVCAAVVRCGAIVVTGSMLHCAAGHNAVCPEVAISEARSVSST